MDYLCSLCRAPAKPKLEYVGVVADCPNGCVEAPLLVPETDIWYCGRCGEMNFTDDDGRCSRCQTKQLSGMPRYRPITEQEERDIADQIEDDQKWDAVESKL